jgi:type VI secretion system secreted protein Hcp
MAQTDYFLKLDGIEGESSDDKHKGEIELLSLSLSGQHTGTGASGSGGSGTGRVQIHDLVVNKKVDKATPKLLLAFTSHQHIKKAEISVRKAGGLQNDYLKITLSDVVVTRVMHSGSASSHVIPTEQLSLNFAKIEMEYKEQKADGSMGGAVKAGWDLAAHKKV